MRRRTPDIAIIVLLFLLPLGFFFQQTLGGKTLLPTENLYQFEPFATYREVVGAPDVPHNHLLSDMVLQNYQWKSFIRQQLSAGEIPLWNPHQFSGIPFLAAGQQSALYPLSIVYYVLPLTVAYGWFVVLNLWLAGVFMWMYIRGLGVGRAGSTLAGVIYQLAGFMLVSVVFPMIVGAAVWLPLLLLMVENIIRERRLWKFEATPIPWVAIGAVALGCNTLAGHVEITIYTLLITGYYGLARLLVDYWQKKAGISQYIRKALWLVVMIGLGLGLASIQFIPLFEFVQTNWRAERSSLDTVLSYAHPSRDMLQFLMPNVYGNPAHHSYFDLFTMQTVTDLTNAAGEHINFIDWGIKNYVEGALYVGILPLILAGYALYGAFRRKMAGRFTVGIFGLLGVVSLTFMFGLPTYAAIYILPGINQLNSPFRWVFGLTVSVAVLAGIGLDYLARREYSGKRIGIVLSGIGGLILGGLLLSRVFYGQIEVLVERVFTGMAKAPEAFADTGMFYSYQFPNVLILGVMVLLSGLMFWWAARAKNQRWSWFAIGVVAVDLMLASWGFNPASDPALLDFTPPAIVWLQGQEGDWRYITLDDSTQYPIMNANVGWRYRLDDVRGYESIIPKAYVDYMRGLAPQVQLDFNRVAPLYTDYGGSDFDYREAFDNYQFDFLNIKYVVTHKTTDIDSERLALRYEDVAVRIWEFLFLFPRAFVYGSGSLDDVIASGELLDARQGLVLRESSVPTEFYADTGRERFADVHLAEIDNGGWLIVSENYVAGWRAFVRPLGAGDDEEAAYDVQRVNGIFQGVRLPQGDWTVRLVYSPASFQVGLFGSVISVALITFLLGVWFWRSYVGVNTDESSTAARVARNSIAPIILNLFNRGIDFAFAIVMLRILSPEDVGIYYFAIVVFVWFDIFTNFGLDLFLIREASRQKERAGYFFYNTTFLRTFLSLLGIPLLVGFLAIWQSNVEQPLTQEGLIALGLLYLGLFPASLSKGMTSLFYAYEQAEKPAAIATITTINKAIFGVIALLLGYGIIGLAAVSILNNIITFVVLVYTGRHFIGKLITKFPDRQLIRGMVTESAPLMLNHFLAHIFFQIDIIILQALKGAIIVGQYSVAYRWLLAINIIPSFFTQALFPVMSRQAKEDREALKRTYTLGIKLMMILALPMAVVFTALAETLTFILGGAQYLPNGAIALQLMIWSIPLGWMNSLTQYVLVALDLQRQVTRAFLAAVLFNIVVNLIFIPQYSFQAAAVATIASELVLLLPFAYLVHRGMGQVDWRDLLWRPLVATMMMVVMTLAVWSIQPLFALAAGSVLYVAVLMLLRPLSDHEVLTFTPMLPGRLQESRMVRTLLGMNRFTMPPR